MAGGGSGSKDGDASMLAVGECTLMSPNFGPRDYSYGEKVSTNNHLLSMQQIHNNVLAGFVVLQSRPES